MGSIKRHSQTMLTRQGGYLGGPENVNGMQIFPCNNKGIFSKMSTKCRGMGKIGQRSL